ncbi:MAG: DUF6468 domain-containing protein [Kiloniellaceae bacterium]
MAWLQDYGLVFDIVICLLLVTTIGYAVALNRKLGVLRSARGELEKLFGDFAAATGQAEGGLQALKEGSAQASDSLAKNVTDACRLAEEMAFLVKKGNEIADRLEVQIAASRKVNPAAAVGLSGLGTPAPAPAPSAAAASATGETMKPQAPQDPAAEAAARGIAKLAKRKLSGADSELMRTLQAIR